ncbi:MAG: hypothetical protein KDN22_31735 [Verrucomicrobiae bacterium]|nr:hypothetical protein [Verrucomicrobiae bacterium]
MPGAIDHESREDRIGQFLRHGEPGGNLPASFGWGKSARREAPGGKPWGSLDRAEFQRSDGSEVAVAASTAGPEQIGIFCGINNAASPVDHAHSFEQVARQAELAGENPIAATKSQTAQAHARAGTSG